MSWLFLAQLRSGVTPRRGSCGILRQGNSSCQRPKIKKKKNVLENEVALAKFASHTFNFLLCNFLHRVDLYFPVDVYLV